MSHNEVLEAAIAAGLPIEQAVAVFMLHPETLAESTAAGYQNPIAGYVAGRGGVLGEATAVTVTSVFVVFEPNLLWGPVGGRRRGTRGGRGGRAVLATDRRLRP